ncbi:MAG: sugar MFS transporter [Chitinophagaceae bacterium]|nr:sugar MFS transporter [Chitinophagaceae bacterium]
MNQETKWSQFGTLISVFFFWGFVAASNGILIPLFKEKMDLTQFQAQLVDLAFYIAYFVGSILYFLVARIWGMDPLNRIGYKNGIVYGLMFSAIGAFLFYPAAQTGSYALFLTALFIVGLGFSLQQTAAQPYAIAMGHPSTGAQRLNLAGGINNFGTTLGPVIVSLAIFGTVKEEGAALAAQNASLGDVKGPYLVLGAAFLLVALIFRFAKLPAVKNEEIIEKGFGALKYPQLVLGMIGIFVYVGVEVSIASNLGEYLKQKENLDSSQIAHWVSLFWASMMIGRWTGAVSAFNPSKTWKSILTVIVPFVAFGIYMLINYLRGVNVFEEMLPYSICILVMIVTYFISQDKPAKMQLIYSILGGIAMLIGIFTSGKISLFALISGGLFCSVMWPCIFNLAVAGLGKYTSQGSAFLIMMILGGAVIPPLQGAIADKIGIQESYWVAFACFVYLGWFAIRVKSVLKSQGIDYESASTSGGH